MTFVQLSYFVKIVDCGSINSAAAACYVSYNAMYKALKSLEKEVETELVDRNVAGVTLTAVGERVYKDAVKILEMERGWKALGRSGSGGQVVKICSTPLFVNNDALKCVSQELRPEGILLDYQAAFPDYLKAMFQQKSDFVFLYPHSPEYSFRKLARENGYHSEYLCSDECYVFLNRDYMEERKESVRLEELASFTPIRITNSYDQLTSFDPAPLFENAPECHTFQSYEEAMTTLLQEKSFLLLRSSVKDHVQSRYSSLIETMRLEDFATGTDYYLANRADCGEPAKMFARRFRQFCRSRYRTEKYYD